MKEKLKKKKNHYNKNQNGNIEGYGFMLKKQITQSNPILITSSYNSQREFVF